MKETEEARKWFNKGYDLGELGKHEDAIKCYNKAIEIKPNYEQAWFGKGYDLGKLGKHEDSIKCYNKAIEIKPNYEQAWFGKGHDLGKLGKHEDSIKCYNKAIEIKPNDEQAWFNKGHDLGKLGKHEDSIKCYNKAIEIKPNYEKAWFNKGHALEELGKHKEANRHYDRAYKLVKGMPIGEHDLTEQAEPTRFEEVEIVSQWVESTSRDWVRFALVQLDFSVRLNNPPQEFGYSLEKEQETKDKIFKALQIAEKNDVNIVCFPELSTSEEWVREVKEHFKNMIVIFGTYYKDGFNVCPIIIDGNDYYTRKINPSPHSEKEVRIGRGMKKGKTIPVFQTKYGRFAVLICLDYIEEAHRILHNSEEKTKNVDFIVVPECNADINLFQEQANTDCQKDNYPYIIQVNALKVNNKKIGGTSIIGTDHRENLTRYTREGLRFKRSIQFKLYEAKDETVSIIDLDIKKKGVQVPSTGSDSEFKVKFVDRIPIA